MGHDSNDNDKCGGADDGDSAVIQGVTDNKDDVLIIYKV